jgi:hypothetical protein
MSQPTNQPGSPDVAVLNERQIIMAETVRDLAKATQDGFAQVNSKLENITQLTVNFTQLQALQQSHSEGLDRAFKRIDAHEKKLEDLGRKANWSTGFVAAIGGIGGIALGLIIWAVTPWFDTIKSNTEAIKSIQIEAARRPAP